MLLIVYSIYKYIKKGRMTPFIVYKKTKKKVRWFDFHKIKTFTVQSKCPFALGPLKGKTITIKKTNSFFI